MIFKYIRLLVPPIFLVVYHKFFKVKPNGRIIEWFGNFDNWEEAQRMSDGYDSNEIFEKVRMSTLQVMEGKGAYERDGVVFDKLEYSWPLLACLLRIAALNNNRLRIIDFGGSLGSSFIQHRSFLNHLEHFEWNIVEQNHFVEFGRSNVKVNGLSFFNSIADIRDLESINVILFSGVLQYLGQLKEIVDLVNKFKFPYVIIDKTAIIKSSKSKITIQNVPGYPYTASYPARFFNETELLRMFRQYELVIDFPSYDYTVSLGETHGYFRGYLLELKSQC